MVTGDGIGMKIGTMTRDGLKMIGLVQLLVTLIGPMMIGHGTSQIGMHGLMSGELGRFTEHSSRQLSGCSLTKFLNHYTNCNQAH